MAAALLGLTLAIAVASVAIGLGYEPYYDTLLYAAQTCVFAGVGLLIARRQPRNRMGWLFLGLALLQGSVDLGQSIALRNNPGVEDWTHVWGWSPVVLGWSLVFLLFPDGRLPSRRWRWWVPVAAISLALVIPGRVLDNDVLYVTGLVPYFGALVGSVVALVMRLRRSRGEERLQLKWFAYAATLVVVVLAASLLLWYVTPVVRVLTVLVDFTIPIAAGVAILRYRLYDIDVIINRTLVYGALTAMLAATYAGVTLGLGTVLGRGSTLTTAAATLTAAVAFRPLRAHLQDAVDRRFDRARYAARQRIGAFLEDLREGRAEPEQVTDLLREVLDDPALELRFLGPGERPTTGATVVERAGVPLVEVRHTAPHDRLSEACDAAGLALEIARHVEDVRASRARLVAAGDAERLRIERDLHDGAQQRLVSIGLALRHVQHKLGDDAPNATLAGAMSEIVLAIAERRELARGVRPVQLDAGLRPALRELAERAPMTVTVEATADRFDESTEIAAFFVAAEGLTNAIKHARAGSVVLSAHRHNGSLVVRVRDDGLGGAAAGPGSGLAGLADRVVAHGGRLRVDSPAGRGTTLTAELPCES